MQTPICNGDTRAMTNFPAPPSAFNLATHLIARNAERADRIAYID